MILGGDFYLTEITGGDEETSSTSHLKEISMRMFDFWFLDFLMENILNCMCGSC